MLVSILDSRVMPEYQVIFFVVVVVQVLSSLGPSSVLWFSILSFLSGWGKQRRRDENGTPDYKGTLSFLRISNPSGVIKGELKGTHRSRSVET